ncbi:hypothetical protein EVAR_520_1 [Eumeta japonica]|uniref:Uncharacterized protein n=1 Tax=Eumeta variegata TaxID=151549 RepID=A0A4C1SB06_EUMVA|nr:hypothetical protein EVAR_520_1 [Eumeta japonica]
MKTKSASTVPHLELAHPETGDVDAHTFTLCYHKANSWWTIGRLEMLCRYDADCVRDGAHSQGHLVRCTLKSLNLEPSMLAQRRLGSLEDVSNAITTFAPTA